MLLQLSEDNENGNLLKEIILGPNPNTDDYNFERKEKIEILKLIVESNKVLLDKRYKNLNKKFIIWNYLTMKLFDSELVEIKK